jgi:hypothetical protein
MEGSLLDTSPKPMRTCVFFAKPFMITVSLSLMNLRSVPSFNWIGFYQVSSSIDLYLVGPDMVPDPIISPDDVGTKTHKDTIATSRYAWSG